MATAAVVALPVIRQSIAGCLADRIGEAGLPATTLSSWLARLDEPMRALARARETGGLPLLSIVDREDDIVTLEDAMAALTTGARTVVILGTGGSSLGGQTLAQLNGWSIPGAADEAQKRRPRTRFYDNLDATTLAGALERLDLASTRFVVISKSGSTPETLTQAVSALGAVRRAGLAARIPSLFLGLTEPAATGRNNGLRRLCEHHRIPVLDHHPGIGGRFSILTNVGLSAAVARGLDARALRRGARGVVDALASAAAPDAFAPAVGAAVAVALARERGIRVNVMLPYADRLARFSHWYVQLWAESLGKSGNGTTPLAALGPLDQHSQLQLFMDGPSEHYLTVLRVGGGAASPPLDADLAALAGIGFMGGRSVADLVSAQAEAVPEALAKAGRPVRLMDLPRLDEENLGALLMHMMLETVLAAHLLGVDPYDQPAVELAKVLTRQRLGG